MNSPDRAKNSSVSSASELGVAVVISLVIVIDCISMAALVFTGDLARYLSVGMGLFLASAAIIGVIVGSSSTFTSTIAHPKSIAGALFALMATSAAASLSGPPLVSTVLCAIALATVLTGLLFFVVGQLEMGKLTRFIPYPVTGGFLAGMGWLIVDGSFCVLTGRSLAQQELSQLLQPAALVQWVFGLLFALALLLAQRRYRNILLVPAMVALFFVAFYLLLLATGNSVAQAFEKGWLIGPFPGGLLWKPWGMFSISDVSWSFISGQAGNILAVVLLSTLGTLLNYSGLELLTEHEFELNRELKWTGAANIVAGLFGGPVGFASPVFCVLAHRAGATRRITTVVMPLVCTTALIFGASVLAYTPRALVGGFLMSLGLGFLVHWLYDSRRQLSRLDYALVLAILVLIAWWGFLQGFVTGILSAVAIFIVNYSRTDVIKHVLSGVHFRSNVDRSRKQRQILTERGDRILILRLQGYLFFGTSNNVYDRVKQWLTADDTSAPRFVVLDFEAVSGMDSSAIMSFEKIKRLAAPSRALLLLSGTSRGLHRLFYGAGFIAAGEDDVLEVEDLDHAMERCEDSLLEHVDLSVEEPETIRSLMSEFLSEPEDVDLFLGYLERLEVPAEQVLVRQGDAPDQLYFIEQGQVEVLLDSDNGPSRRLRSLSAGSLVGEMGMFSRSPRTATVKTREPSVLYRLTVSSMGRMRREHPGLLACFQTAIVQQLIKRLADSNKMVEALQR